MASQPKHESQPPSAADPVAQNALVDCGLIMPISATANHDEKHWASVQTLLHRGIRSAGLNPANVWEGVNDRISKRIVGNIFKQDVVVADISDLNPNVMLELGLRLASKKPTVVVFNKGGKIPFDISDVEAIAYPSDLNILEMEAFFEKFTALLQSRLNAYIDKSYEPFLSDVIVEVLEPQTKEVSLQHLVIERLDEIGSRLSRLERGGSQLRARPDLSTRGVRPSQTFFCWVASDLAEAFSNTLQPIARHYAYIDEGGKSYFAIKPMENLTSESFNRRLATRLSEFEGAAGAPDEIVDRLKTAALVD